MSQITKRSLALICLLLGISTFVKLAKKPVNVPVDPKQLSEFVSNSFEAQKSRLLEKYQSRPEEYELVLRVLDKFAQTAISLEATDGIRGLKLLDTLDLEAVYLYENHPREFRRLCEIVTDEAAARILLTWRDYIGLKRADHGDRALWISELERLSPSDRLIVEKYPDLLPLMMSDPEAVSGLIQNIHDQDDLQDCLIALQIVSLKQGPSSLRLMTETFESHPRWAIEAFRRRGPEGLLIVTLFGDVIENLNNSELLDDVLIALHVSNEDSLEYIQRHSPESLANQLRHLSAVALLDDVANHPHALKLTLEYGAVGENAIRLAGSDAAEVIYSDYTDRTLRSQAVRALADHGIQAAVVLEKYATDPTFRDILRNYGSAIIPPIAQTDLSPQLLSELRQKSDRSNLETLALTLMNLSGDSGQATIQMIHEDGLDRVSQVYQSELSAVELLPLYDLTHLANVLRKGYQPTSGEWTWAVVDGAFVVADVLSLTALQPEGVAVTEMTRSQVKNLGRSAVREGAENISQAIAKTGVQSGEQGLRRASRWWAVRTAGGLHHLYRDLPLAMQRMSLSQIDEMLRPLARRAGVSLSRFEPLRFLKNGQEVLMRIPPEKGLKYLAVESAQAGLGLAAFWKMEEHLSSRRHVSVEEISDP